MIVDELIVQVHTLNKETQTIYDDMMMAVKPVYLSFCNRYRITLDLRFAHIDVTSCGVNCEAVFVSSFQRIRRDRNRSNFSMIEC